MPTQPLPRSTFHLGLDLGFRRNPSALAILEELTRKTGEFDHVTYVPKTETVLILRAIQALPLETPYADIPDLLHRSLRSISDPRTLESGWVPSYPAAPYPVASHRVSSEPRTSESGYSGPTAPGYSPTHIQHLHLAVDATGVGAPVVELLQRAQLPVTLHPIVITAGQSVGKLPHADSVPRDALLHNVRIHLELGQIRIPAALPNLAEFHTQLCSLGTNKPGNNDMAFAFALALWSARPQPIIGEQSTPIPGTPGGDNAAIRRLERLIEDHTRRRR